MKLNINIVVSIEQADLEAFNALDILLGEMNVNMSHTDLEARLGKDRFERLRMSGMFDSEYMDFCKDVVYWISDLGQRTLSGAIQAGVLPSREV